MRHQIFSDGYHAAYPIALLIKSTSFLSTELINNYLAPLDQRGIAPASVIAFTLDYTSAKKVSVSFIKTYLEQLLPQLAKLNVKHVYCADSNYFKVLTGKPKADVHLGYVLPCKVKGYESLQIILGLNYQALIYNPASQPKLDLSLDTLAASVQGQYQAIGTGIIHSATYPESYHEVRDALRSLHGYPTLTCDIEGFSLRFNEAGIGSIAFAWDQHNGLAFAVDWTPSTRVQDADAARFYGYLSPNLPVRGLLKEFFETYQGEITWHHSPYDLKVIIYELWMENLLDTKGLLEGLEVMTRNFHDTKVIAYLATNTTAGNDLGLKSLAHEFAGNWAVETIKDIGRIPLPELLQYNLIDALSTWYVKDKLTPVMIADDQEDLYYSLMLPTQKLIIQIELTGMPLSPTKVQEVKTALEAIQQMNLDILEQSTVIKALNLVLQNKAMETANAKLVKKVHPLEKFQGVAFNPGSDPQVRHLLYDQMGLPVLDLTDTKLPSTKDKTISKLIHHTQNAAYQAVLSALIGYAKVSTILQNFIPAFERSIQKGDGMAWLHGSILLGGTVSGRNSSSEPNMQNIPAREDSLYAKLIKECFMAPVGWLLCGADFNSLEDMISALTTRDPQKLKVYESGFDGHALRAVSYFKDQLPHIDPTDPQSVNQLKKQDHPLRQESKGPTFLLTYGGTFHGLMHNLGWDKEKAQRIEEQYHELYKVSDAYVQSRLKQACSDGYVDVAFGLRVRTPLLSQIVWDAPKIPYEAASEKRTAGNALGQSYGLLNNRAAMDFMRKVWISPYRHDIKPVNLIHDAVYLVVRDDVHVVAWANQELIKSMQWQQLPEIRHDTVKLGATLEIYWPSWAHGVVIPNGADNETIFRLCQEAKAMQGSP